MHQEHSSVLCSDQWVVHPRGRLFVRRWVPAGPHARQPGASPIVLLHDSLGCVALWRDFPAQLAAATGREVIAYDRLGFGRSDPRTDRPAPGFIAEEATVYFPVLRQQLGLARFVALGHSVGGGMGVHLASEAGPACEALVTIAAQAFIEERTVQGIRAAKQGFGEPGQMARLAKYHGDKAPWVLAAWTETWLDPRFADWSLAPVLPRVHCPLLVLHGEQDEYGSPRHPELIGRLSAGPATVDVLAGVGHVPHREQPHQVLRRVAEFLATLPGQGVRC